ncbi:hypothetical protein PR202_gb24428 [Eleusine coracana subsp. coracana]|uniref:Protein kinase domain-containing protein n=1 Tax=Eleusine coracana subsp. coracana TaxID=191504 RepID=A0AAV5FIP1_ELECO|nr:hypothetical protein PR202_gb24428 [Eleusine coracana subsp. coracana]
MDKTEKKKEEGATATRAVGLRAAAFAIAALLCSTASLALSPDGEALLELKLAFNATTQRLTTWRPSDPNPCGWEGISCSLPDLRVQSINLPYMQLGGIISPSIGKLDKLQRLALHQNSLHGSIPPEIKNCTELRAIYMRANYLQGGIPSEIGELIHLTILDLSSNLLRGTIPASIGSLTHLRFLNLSTNFFSGEIPNVGVLGTFKSSSLCGLSIQKACRGTLGFPAVLPHSDPLSSSGVSPINNTKTSHFLNGIVIGSMSTLALALIAILGFLWICLLSRKKSIGGNYVKMDKHSVPDGAKLVTYQWNLPYSSSEIIRRLELLDEDDVVGCGGFGTVYKMVMDDGTAFAVKRIDMHREARDRTFEKELEILGSIRHINLLNTLTGEHRLEDIVDERCGDVEVEAVESILDIAAMCTDADPGQRPSMSAVLKMLEEEILSPCMSELCYEQHLEL